jgi:hypothetical protein
MSKFIRNMLNDGIFHVKLMVVSLILAFLNGLFWHLYGFYCVVVKFFIHLVSQWHKTIEIGKS